MAIGGCLAAEPCGYLLGLGMLAEGDITALAGAGALKSTVSISSLRATHGRTMSNGQMKKLVKDIQTNGINEPLTVTNYNNTLYVLDGNNRLIAAPKAGISEVPVNYVELPWGAYKTPNDLVFSPGGL